MIYDCSTRKKEKFVTRKGNHLRTKQVKMIVWICCLILVTSNQAEGVIMNEKKQNPQQMNTQAIDAINRACYDAKAEYWDRMPFADFLPAWILRHYNPKMGKDVLDIGSGTGMLAEWLTKQGFNVLCLDPSPEMVRRTRERGLQTLQTTVQQYSDDKHYGLVIAVLSLIHVPKKEIAAELKKISSWLQPGGLFALAMIEGHGEGIGEQQSPFPRYFAYYTNQEIHDLVQNDFIILEERKVGSPISYLVYLLRSQNFSFIKCQFVIQ